MGPSRERVGLSRGARGKAATRRDLKTKRQGQMCILESMFCGRVRNGYKGGHPGARKRTGSVNS